MWTESALSVLQRYTERLDHEQQLFRSTEFKDFNQHRDKLLLAVGREAADLLHDLIIARKAKCIVELGTSYGYSTLFLANAARHTGGRVITFELADYKQAFARESLSEAGLAEFVDWRLGDAVALLKETPGPFDFVFVDLWKDLYIPCFEQFYPKLANNALIAADNILEPAAHRPDTAKYQAAVRSKKDIESVLLPVGNGIELSCVWRNEHQEKQA